MGTKLSLLLSVQTQIRNVENKCCEKILGEIGNRGVPTKCFKLCTTS